MTARSDDLLAWLDAAISEREGAARNAHATDPAPWTADTMTSPTRDHSIEDGSGLLVAANGEALWDCEGASGLCMTAAASTHIALNDPEAVLRRCAADRKMMEEIKDIIVNGDYTDDGELPLAEHFLQRLAEGYGWQSD